MINPSLSPRWWITLLCASTLITALCPRAQAANYDDLIELMRANIKQEKRTVVTQVMNLTPQESLVFWPLYREYTAELSKLGDQRLDLIKEYAAYYDTLTDKKAEELMKWSFDIQSKRLALQKKFFKKIRKATSATTAARFLQIESQLQAVIDLQISSELPIIPRAAESLR